MFEDKSPQGLKALFTKPDVGVRDAEGMLAKLWRRILCDILGDHQLFQDTQRFALYNRLVDSWVRHPKNGLVHDRNKQATLKGNIAKQVNAKRMSPNVFLTMLQIWRCREFDLIIRPTWENGKTTEHCITFKGLLPETNQAESDQELTVEIKTHGNTELSPIDCGNWSEERIGGSRCLWNYPVPKPESIVYSHRQSGF